MEIIAIASHKGGVGKTTAATNLAAALAAQRQKVLVVDLDPQGNATTSLGSSIKRGAPYVGDLLLHRQKATDVIRPVNDAISVAPATLDLLTVAEKLDRGYYKQEHLDRELKGLRGYDTVIIDCPPALGVLTANAVFAADRIMVPLPLDTFAYSGLADLLDHVEQVRRNPVPVFILISQYDVRTSRMNDTILEALDADKRRIFDTRIPRCEAIRQAQGAQMPVLTFDPNAAASAAFRALAKEVRQHA